MRRGQDDPVRMQVHFPGGIGQLELVLDRPSWPLLTLG